MVELVADKIELRISIEATFLNRLYLQGLKFYPNEYGGILLGVYARDRKLLTISDTIFPKNFVSSMYGFERGSKGMQEALDKRRIKNPELSYVGEWHTHPDMPARASSTDKFAMKNLEMDENVSITNPILLILSINPNGYNNKFYVQYENFLYSYQSV